MIPHTINGFIDLKHWQSPLCFRVRSTYYPEGRLDMPAFFRRYNSKIKERIIFVTVPQHNDDWVRRAFLGAPVIGDPFLELIRGTRGA